jgi:CubicO group peptidase (beta-lactamase class C family)
MNTGRIAELFEENFATHGELGASLAVWKDGVEVLSLAGGFQDRERTRPWHAETPVLFWSATKGLAAACVLHACAPRRVSMDTPVADLWPEFAAAGKQGVTVAEALSHRAGLSALSREVSVLDHAAVAEALAAEAPGWPGAEGHGYHPRTFGFLADEIVRRLTGGDTLGAYWRRAFAEPLRLDLWIGLPAEHASRVAPVFAARGAPPADDPFYRAFMTSGSLTARSFASPRGLHSVSALNTFEARSASFPAFGGIGTARSLAKFYAMLAAGGAIDGQRFFDSDALAAMTRTLTNGPDRVLQIQTAFSAGFMKDPVGSDGEKVRSIFGPSSLAFGHPGAGGSLAFADPENRLAFAYVMNQMEPGVLPNAKSLRLVAELYR